MKKCLLIAFCLFTLASLAQEAAAPSILETAQTYVRQGDYANAVLVLNKALQDDPDNTELLKELAFAFYLQRDYSRSQNISRQLLEKKGADVKTYQIAALSYKALEDYKELDKLYKKGLKAYPASGILYNEYGELLWSKLDNNAIRQWEKGIEMDPNFSGNYYNAARYYYLTMDKVWSIIYGEMFVNLESYSNRTVEIKDILLNSYKKLFTEADIKKGQETKIPFVNAFLDNMDRQSAIANLGIHPESLTMIRIRFNLEWFAKYQNTLSFRLFEYHRQLLKEGLFEAYNQWLFGSSQNLTAFQNWIFTHAEDYNRFIAFQKGRVFKVPANQYYNR